MMMINTPQDDLVEEEIISAAVDRKPNNNNNNNNNTNNNIDECLLKKPPTMSGEDQTIQNDALEIGPSVQLPSNILHELYSSYTLKQKRNGLKWFFVACLLFYIWSICVPYEQETHARVIESILLSLMTVYVLLMHAVTYWRKRSSGKTTPLSSLLLNGAPYFLWTCCIIHLMIYVFLQKTFSPRDILGWAILLNFLIFVTLPIPLFYTGSLMSVTTFLIYVILLLGLGRRDPMYYEMILANIILVATGIAIGLLYYAMGEAKHKRVFLEAKKSLEVKMIIEEQSAEQERLLLSVLPRHVAVKMRQDLGSTASEPFKKIYMSRHENVSILYADIVGFTAISSTYSAQDLVKMLNELFARFDRLSEKYHQLRIKILGDCYYCISGAPDERPDHAVLCVYMGLSMVKAIKYVQQKANSPVDMRVGIHTGAVLAGVLGQRQWQFDVYSKDVVLANKMESSGMAGRVHISDKTLSFLNGEFEVEPAFGEKREEALRIAGLKTYFIVKVVQPFAGDEVTQQQKIANNESIPQDLDEELLAETNPVQESYNESVTEVNNDLDKKHILFKERLQEELVARDFHESLSNDTTVFLKFKNESLEKTYSTYREPYSSMPLIATLAVQCADVLYSYFILPRSPLHFVNIAAPIIPIAMLVIISVAENFPIQLPGFLVIVSKRYNDIAIVRELTAILIVLTLGISNLIDMYFFVVYLKSNHIVSESVFNKTQTGQHEQEQQQDDITEVYPEEESFTIMMMMMNSNQTMNNIMYPSYLSNFAVLILIATAVIAQLTHVTKITLMLFMTVAHCYFNVFILSDLYVMEDELADNPVIPVSFSTSGILIVVAVALSLLARHIDNEDRVVFKWKTEVTEQKEMANDMRQRNEALVYNILPVHVAEHFMKNTKRSHDDLYSQSYAEVGVLFASMPNFSDFYSEESVNNQGLECLRFLNEVISDFDALLELPQFQDIIKIKTIGSTYMAASGMSISSVINGPDRDTRSRSKRWSHLASLVEFALELKNALQSINEQSFNHFVLKMGINHGPITAGVIGARKPHYDIWGNTVNVASRMESTGKAGAIQVTEETCRILEEFGYTFQQRGLVTVKGKGQLMTYYLEDKLHHSRPPPPIKENITIITKESSSSSKRNKIPDVLELTEINIKIENDLDTDIKTPLLNMKTTNNLFKISDPCNNVTSYRE